jgi:hypothetical protein
MKSTQYEHKILDNNYYTLDIRIKEPGQRLNLKIFHTLNDTRIEIPFHQLPPEIFKAVVAISEGHSQTLFQPTQKRVHTNSLKIDLKRCHPDLIPPKSEQPTPSHGFFKSGQQFIFNHKKLLIAGSLAVGIGTGIGLTIAFFDDFVSAALISNVFLLALLASLVVLVSLFASHYIQSSAHNVGKEMPTQKI